MGNDCRRAREGYETVSLTVGATAGDLQASRLRDGLLPSQVAAVVRHDDEVDVRVRFRLDAISDGAPIELPRYPFRHVPVLVAAGATDVEITAAHPRPVIFLASTHHVFGADTVLGSVILDLGGFGRCALAEWEFSNGTPFGKWFQTYNQRSGNTAANGRRDGAIRKMFREGGELGGGRRWVESTVIDALIAEYEAKLPPIWLVSLDNGSGIRVLAESLDPWRRVTADRVIDALSDQAGNGKRRRVRPMTPAILGPTVIRHEDPQGFGPINNRLTRHFDNRLPELVGNERVPTASRMFNTELGRFWWLNWGFPVVTSLDEDDAAAPTDEDTGANAPRPGQEPDWASIDHTGNDAVRRVMRDKTWTEAGLTDRQMEMLKMCDDGYSYEEIATRCGCRVGTVGATVAAGRKKLRKILRGLNKDAPGVPFIYDGGDAGAAHR